MNPNVYRVLVCRDILNVINIKVKSVRRPARKSSSKVFYMIHDSSCIWHFLVCFCDCEIFDGHTLTIVLGNKEGKHCDKNIFKKERKNKL